MFQEELRKYLYCTNLEELKLDESHAIGYTYKCLGAGFWALKQDNFREALEAIVRSVSIVNRFFIIRVQFCCHLIDLHFSFNLKKVSYTLMQLKR